MMKHGGIGMPATTVTQPITERESEISLEGPAPFANRVYVSFGAVVRIAFAEQGGPGKDPHFRSAVSLSIQDATILADLIKTLLRPLETALAQAASDGAKADHLG
jgi:hypothetical protein